MANAIKGEATLDLSDGRQFTLIFDMEALVEAEGLYRKPMHRLMDEAQQGFVGAIRALLYGALRAKHAEISVRDASAMLGSDLEAVNAALERAADAGLPQGDAEGKEGANPPGKTSGRSGAKRV